MRDRERIGNWHHLLGAIGTAQERASEGLNRGRPKSAAEQAKVLLFSQIAITMVGGSLVYGLSDIILIT